MTKHIRYSRTPVIKTNRKERKSRTGRIRTPKLARGSQWQLNGGVNSEGYYGNKKWAVILATAVFNQENQSARPSVYLSPRAVWERGIKAPPKLLGFRVQI